MRRRPLRDSALVYGVLAVLVVVIAAATGGGILRAVGIAALFYALALGYAWLRGRARNGPPAR